MMLEHAQSLQARMDAVGSRFGGEAAQIYLASGNPADEPATTSFADLVDDIRARSNALFNLGIDRAERVSLMTPLGPDSLATLLATMVAATAAPLNYFLEATALVRLIEATGSTNLVVARRFDDDPAAHDKVRAIQEALPGLRIIAYGEGRDIPGAIDFDAEVAASRGQGWRPAMQQVAPQRIAAIFHTGGTTGLPKLVPHTEAMYLAMVRASLTSMGTGPGERVLGGLPLFHTSGALQTGVVPFLNGCGIVIPSSAGFRTPSVVPNYWNFVSRFGVTIGGSVPTILMTLAGIEPAGDVSALKHILCGAAPLPLSTIQAITAKTGGATVVEGWGMTETCGFSVLNPRDRTKLGSVGVPFDGVQAQIRLADGTGGELPTDTIGELVVRGDIVIARYLDERPDSFTPDGWLRTGDLARKDADGYLWIVGRAKDIIIRSGHNIDPAIIETPACEHPAVQFAAAVGRPDLYAGELPVLFVQLRPGAKLAPEALLTFLEPRIHERAAMPKAVHILDEMPLSGPGKILKVPLRREATRAVLQGDVDRVAPGVQVAVVEDDRSGVAIVLTSTSSETGLRQTAANALSGYPFKIIVESSR